MANCSRSGPGVGSSALICLTVSLVVRPINIIYIGRLPPHGGGATLSCSQILSGLVARGHVVRAVAPAPAETAGDPHPFTIQQPKIRVHQYPMPYTEVDATAPAPESYRDRQRQSVQETLRKLVAQEPADVLLVGYESMLWGVPEAAEALRIPCVTMIRGAIVSVFDGRFPSELGARLLAEVRRVDRAICCAHHLAASLTQRGFEHITAIPNALDPVRFSPGPKDPSLLNKLGIQSGDVVVLHASTLILGKRVDDLVASAPIALAEDPRLVYLVLGPAERLEPLSHNSAQWGVRDRFRFIPRVDFAEMPKYMRLADIVVMPSVGEGLARVYLEAQACARLLLASDIPAAREVIRDGETGVLFPVGDVSALAAKTVHAAQNAEFRESIGSQARRQVETHHRLGDAVARYEAELAAVVDEFAQRA